MAKKNIKIFDVTLREGEQTPGLFFSPEEKLQLAAQLCDAGIRHIETGVVGIESDECAYREMRSREIAGTAEISMTLLPCEPLFERALASDVTNLNLVIPVTDCLAATFGFTVDAFLEQRMHWIDQLCRSGKQLRVALADASRALLLDERQQLNRDPAHITGNIASLEKVIAPFLERGVTGFILTDTAGLLLPEEVALVMQRLAAGYPEVEWGGHFHNDFGLAAANTLAASRHGATLLQCSFNSLGERCGIASTAEIVAGLQYLYGRELGIDLGKIRRLAYAIEDITGIVVCERQPVVGRGLYWYETATPLLTLIGHRSSMFETIPAESAGSPREIVIGKHSSRRLFKLYQQERLVASDHDIEAYKNNACKLREENLPVLRRIIRRYHAAAKASHLMLPPPVPEP